jgi:large subunit ribosomal protein L18
MKKKLKKIYLQQKKRYLKKIIGTLKKPRLSVFKSHKHIYAQLIDDTNGSTLAFSSSLDKILKEQFFNFISSEEQKDKNSKKKITPQQIAFLVGENLGKKAVSKKISSVIFDRGNHRYHGRIKNIAEGARKQGLIF